jgi:ATP-dependent Clp protease ATP-binding subunit ClpA
VLSNELEVCLNSAFHRAREARCQYLTVEHLLLAILGSPEIGEILGACRADLGQLKQELQDHLGQSTPRLAEGDDREVQPALAFQRVLQRAVYYVQSSGKEQVGVGDVLVAIFSEKQSHAVNLLTRQHVTRLDVVNYRSRGLSKPGYETGEDDNEEEDGVESEDDSGPPEPANDHLGWSLERFENLLAAMSDADIEALWQRSEHDPKSLSIDETGVLFLVLRKRVRALEARLKNDLRTDDNRDD